MTAKILAILALIAVQFLPLVPEIIREAQIRLITWQAKRESARIIRAMDEKRRPE